MNEIVVGIGPDRSDSFYERAFPARASGEPSGFRSSIELQNSMAQDRTPTQILPADPESDCQVGAFDKFGDPITTRHDLFSRIEHEEIHGLDT